MIKGVSGRVVGGEYESQGEKEPDKVKSQRKRIIRHRHSQLKFTPIEPGSRSSGHRQQDRPGRRKLIGKALALSPLRRTGPLPAVATRKGCGERVWARPKGCRLRTNALGTHRLLAHKGERPYAGPSPVNGPTNHPHP